MAGAAGVQVLTVSGTVAVLHYCTVARAPAASRGWGLAATLSRRKSSRAVQSLPAAAARPPQKAEATVTGEWMGRERGAEHTRREDSAKTLHARGVCECEREASRVPRYLANVWSQRRGTNLSLPVVLGEDPPHLICIERASPAATGGFVHTNPALRAGTRTGSTTER